MCVHRFEVRKSNVLTSAESGLLMAKAYICKQNKCRTGITLSQAHSLEQLWVTGSSCINVPERSTISTLLLAELSILLELWQAQLALADSN